MIVKSFVDADVVLYTIGQDKLKAEIARKLSVTEVVVSTQVINECVNVCLRKLGL